MNARFWVDGTLPTSIAGARWPVAIYPTTVTAPYAVYDGLEQRWVAWDLRFCWVAHLIAWWRNHK